MSAFEKISLPGVKCIITVASGKGGVGKGKEGGEGQEEW